MKVTSEQFKTKAENQYGTVYQIKALVDGIEITDEIQDFEYSSMTNPDGEFTFGNTCASQISFKIDTPSQNLTDREITIQQGIDIDGVVEYLNIGVFKVLKPENTRSVYTYQCVDRMVSRMEMPYFSELTYPATDIDILEEICNQVNISLDNADSLIPHTLQSAPSGYTRREIIGYMAQLQGKNAIINGDGNLELKWYNNVDYIIDDDRIYLDGSDSIKDETNYILGYIECSVSTSSDEEIKTIKSGTGNIGIKTENPFMTQEILDEVFSVIGGFSFMPVEVQFLGDFRLEVGDIVTVETYGKTYQVPIMQLTHSSDGGVVTTIESVAETDSENEISFTNPTTKQMERYYAELVLINKALVNKLGVEELDAVKAEITTLVVGEIDGRYANIDMANVNVADIGILFNRVGLIDRATIVDGHITGFLDAVEINANKITAGTLVTDRLLLSGAEGSILFELNNLGELTSTNVDTLDGYVLTDRTITADKIIANSITANELDVTNIFGNTAVLRTIVAQDIFSDAIATHTMVVGAYEYAEEAINLSNSTNESTGSPIHLTDSADGTAIEFGAYGRSEQNGEPTPNNPIDIKSVADSGWFDGELLQGNYGSGTGNYASSTTFVCSKNPIPCNPNDNIKLVYEDVADTLYILFYDKNMTYLTYANESSSNSVSGTVPSNAYYFKFNVGINAGITPSTAKKIVVTINDMYALKVKSNSENLFDKDTSLVGYYNNDGSFVSDAGWRTCKIATRKDNKITVSGTTHIGSGNPKVVGFKSDGSIDVISSLTVGTATYDGSDYKYIGIPVISDSFEIIQMYYESSVCIPLTEPLRSSLDGSVKDEIACVDGVYGVVRRFAEVVFDGTQTLFGSTVLSNTVRVVIFLENKSTSSANGICDSFIFNYSYSLDEEHLYVSNDYVFVFISQSRLTSTNGAGINAWLQSNPIEVQYELAEPIFEPFEDQTPFSNIVTYNSVTTISATDNPEMRVEYYRNNKNGEQFSSLTDANKKVENVANEANATANTANTNATNAYNRATYHYGTCSTAAATAAKVVTLNGFALYTGAQVTVQFAYGNTATNPTLNVNGTGAKNIRVNNANITSKYYWSDNNTVTFTYNGSYWIMSDSSANTILANWASSNDITYIDGGKIYTNSITAEQIDVKDLFAQDITATGKISGAKLYGTYLESISGKIGGFTISGSALYNNTSSITSNENGIYVGTNGIRTVSDYGSVTHSGYYSKYEDRPTDDVGRQTIVSPSGVGIYGYTYNGAAPNCGVEIYKDDTIYGSIDTDGIRNPSTLILGFDGSARLTSLNVSGTAYVGGATTLESTLDVKGNATIGSNASKIQIGKAGTGTNATSITLNNSLWINPYDNIVILKNNCGLYGVNTSGDYTILAAIDNLDRCLIGTNSDTVLIGKNPTSTIVMNGGVEVYGTIPHIDFHYNNGTSDYNVRLMNSVSGQLRCQGHFIPSDGGVYTSGISGARWKEIWCTQSSINSSSDRNVKKDIANIENNYDGFYDSLIPVSYRFIDGESNRLHIGFISQDVEDALINNDLTALDFAGFCKDIKQKEVVIKEDEYDENGNLLSAKQSEWVDEVDENGNPVYEYGLRYSEFIALNTNQIQKLKTRVNILEEENRELKENINNILLRLQVLEERG